MSVSVEIRGDIEGIKEISKSSQQAKKLVKHLLLLQRLENDFGLFIGLNLTSYVPKEFECFLLKS